ncbi:MAG TPA: carboxypeptidase regulatory-like domain-containing protein [Hyalangium sp.]|jgi:hypothetical protein|nr:carboxypeptidase regulatory-like domain-containing protein [Hyalangium sp.]
MKKLALVLVPFLVLGCGEELADTNGDGIADGVQDPNNVSVVVPATPKGTVSGQVLTTQQRPLAGVNVAMTIGSSTTPKVSTTDEGGNFTFQDVPGGAQILLTFTKEGFAPLRAFSTVPTTAGNVPINNGNASFGPVLLSETSGSVKFTLISPTGRPAAGVRASLEVDGAGVVLFGPTASVSSTVVAEAVADAQGVVTFNNVPPPAEIDRITTASAYKLVVYAYDENNDGILESNGDVKFYTGSGLLTGANAIPLALQFTYSPAMPLEISFSNMAALSGGSTLPQSNMLKPGDSINIVFNQPVQPSSVIVGLTDEYGQEVIGINKTPSNGGLVLTLAPQNILPGKEYNLYIRAVSLNGGTSLSRTVSFFGGDPTQSQAINVEATIRFWDTGGTAGATTRNNNQLDNGEYVSISFNQVMSFFGSTPAQVYFDRDLDGTTTAVTGEWNPNNTAIAGFNLLAYEPQTFNGLGLPADPIPVFGGIPASGYSSRYFFQYVGTGYVSFSAATTVPLVFAFNRIRSPQTNGYESIWGVPQTANISVTATLVAIPP